MTTSETEPTYGQSWRPERPRLKLFPLLVAWLATGVALMVASWLLPGVDIKSFWAALVVAAIVAALNAVIPPILAALRLPLTLVLGFLLVLIADALILRLAAETDRRSIHRRQLRLGAPRRTRRRRGERRARGASRLGRHGVDPQAQRIAKRQGIIASTDVPGIVYLEIDGLAKPVLQRAMRDGNAPNMARWARETHSTRRVGDRSLLADGCQPGGHPPGIERGHLRLSLGGEGDRDDDDVLRACGLRGARAPARDRHRPPRRRRRQPRQPALRRGRGRDPHRQPHGSGEEVQPRLPGVLRERRQRDAHARPLRVGGHPRVDGGSSRDPPGRAAAWPPRRHLPADARRALRLRPRPDRLGCAHRHHARAACDLRDVLELRRGRAPLRPRARGHPRSPAQARRPLRPDRACVPVRPAAVRDRGPLGPRADPGSDLQAAQRLRPRRARRALARAGRRLRHRRRRRAELDGRPRGRRGDGQDAEEAQERRLRSRRRRDGLRQPRPRLPDGGAPAAHDGGDRRAASRAPAGSSGTSARRLAARSLLRARRGRARRKRDALSTEGRVEGEDRSRTSHRTRRSTCSAPTASSTSATSWSGASTTPISTRAARSRS